MSTDILRFKQGETVEISVIFELAYTVGRDKTGKTSGELVICNW